MKASDLFIKALENEKVKYIFGVPGEENLDFMESLRKSKIKFILTRHEQAAGFMAATVGRLSGKIGVCLSTLGPGATNLVTAAAYAQLGAMPMMMITGQKPINISKQGSFQIVDSVQILDPLTKYSKEIVSADRIPSMVREAVKEAEEERPGAVHLVLPEDIAIEKSNAKIFKVNEIRRPVAENKSIEKAVDLIAKAKCPLLLIGAGANRKRVAKMLTEFVADTGILFFSTQMGKGVIDERNKLYMGTASLSADDFLHCAIEKSDLIINVGHDVVEKPPFIMNEDRPKVIHINFSSAKVDNVYFPQHEVIGDIANAIWRIKEALTNKTLNWDMRYFHKIKQKIDKHIIAHETDYSFPFKPQTVVRDVRAAMPSDGITTLDNGMYKIWFSRNYKTFEPNTLILDNALATMGAGLPSAIAAKILYPDKKVLAVVGDGGFMMNSQELETAVRLKLDLVVLVLNDNSFGMIKWKQKIAGFKSFGLDYNNPDFVKYAESYGVKAYSIKQEDSLEKILGVVLNNKGVQLIEVPIDYSQDITILNQALNFQCAKIN